MRSINIETGEPWPRKRPINWGATRRILRDRQADRKLKDAGYMRVAAFAALPWESPYCTHRIVEAVIHPDGMGLYVKVEPKRS